MTAGSITTLSRGKALALSLRQEGRPEDAQLVDELAQAVERQTRQSQYATTGQVAQQLGVSRQTLDKVINARGSITPDMAIRFEKVFGSSADTWLRLQLAYDLAQAREREADIIATIRPRPERQAPKQPSLI